MLWLNVCKHCVWLFCERISIYYATKVPKFTLKCEKRESRIKNQEPQATVCVRVRVRTRVIALIHSSSTLIGMCIVCIQNKRTHFKHCKHCMHINGRTTSISQSVGCLCCLIKMNGLIKKNMVGFILLAAQTNKSMKMHAHDPFYYFLFASIARMQYQRMCVCVYFSSLTKFKRAGFSSSHKQQQIFCNGSFQYVLQLPNSECISLIRCAHFISIYLTFRPRTTMANDWLNARALINL